MAERNRLDDDRMVADARELTPGQRLAQALELSDLGRALALATGANWVVSPVYDLAEKGRRYPVGH